MTDLDLDWLISVDDHILEPPDLWTSRISGKHQDRAPRMVTEGAYEFWTYDGKNYPTVGLSAVAGKSKEEFSPEPVTYAEMRPGCYDPVARLDDMDKSGVLASLCFPTITRFCGQMFYEASDQAFGLECLKVYNDWLLEDWCGAAPGRYIPLTLIPLWDPALAAKELERCHAKGSNSFAFSENPTKLGLPSIHDRYWDPVFGTASDLGMVASMHVGSSSNVPKISDESPFLANLAWGAIRTAAAMLDWVFSSQLDRHPNLRIALSEGEIGWMPYFIERAEQVVDKQRFWVAKGQNFMDFANSDVDLETIDVRERVRKHIFGCFIDDRHGIASLDEIGEDNIMIETDYPHSDSTWPNCIAVAKEQIGHLPAETQYKLLRGNAEKLYRFTPAAAPDLSVQGRVLTGAAQ